MACMSHECYSTACGWYLDDNTRGPWACPQCGGRVSHMSDEYYDDGGLDDGEDDDGE